MTFRKGVSGNPGGRKRGETPRGRFTRLVDDALPAIVNKLVKAAKAGDVQAARLILDRCIAPLRAADEGIKLALPAAAGERGEAIVAATTAGRLTPTQAVSLLQIVELAQVLGEHRDLAARLEAVEQWLRTSGR